MELNNSLSGEYNLVITSQDGTSQETGWIKNLILDQGLERIGQSASVVPYCQIGTGTTVPVVTQTALVAFTAGVSGTGTSVTNSGSPLYNSVHTFTYAFAQGAVVGNMAEVGVGWASSGANLFSRALITDISGNPTTLTLTSIDQLTVYYRLTVAPSMTDVSGTLSLGGSDYQYTGRLAYAGSHHGSTSLFLSGDLYTISTSGYQSYVYPSSSTLGAVTATPTGSGTGYFYNNGLGPGTVSLAPYGLGTKYRDTTQLFPIGVGNVGGIGAIMQSIGDNAWYQYAFTPAIPKDNTKTLSMTYRVSWDRA